MTDPTVQHARDINARALSDMTQRIAAQEREYPPSVVPIVAANVAMASMLDQLLDLDVWRVWEMLPELLDVCNPAAPGRPRVTR
jgi:hypothetical protein